MGRALQPTQGAQQLRLDPNPTLTQHQRRALPLFYFFGHSFNSQAAHVLPNIRLREAVLELLDLNLRRRATTDPSSQGTHDNTLAMSTPTPMKHPASQQGRTPSQLPGATPSQLTGATPPVSTPFSNAAQTAFSPRNPRSSPQQVKKSPATSLLGQLPMSFDSPATAAALGLGDPSLLGGDHVEDLHDLRPITRDDDKLKKLETILDILSVSGDL